MESVEIVILVVAVLLGAVVQGAVGFGFALLVVPALILIQPEALPATVLLLTIPMALTMAAREWRAIDASGLLYLLSGRLVGTFGGVGLLIAGAGRVPLRALWKPPRGGRARELVKPASDLA